MKIIVAIIRFSLLLLGTSLVADCNKPVEPEPPIVADTLVSSWLTKGNQSALLEKQTTTLKFDSLINAYPSIVVDESQTFQTVDGFGYTLTGGSVEAINSLSATVRQELLQNLFGNTDDDIELSYLRISIGASDLNASVFSYNDLPQGQSDIPQANFSITPDNALVEMLKEILQINPDIKIMAVPWSAPLWMKTNYNSVGSSLFPTYYSSYATYFVKYIQAMKAEGITIDAVCPQNEPQHGGNNPSMLMTAAQQISFIKKLGPAFQANGITTKIVCYDHNCDNPEYPIQVLNDTAAVQYVDGYAFHL